MKIATGNIHTKSEAKWFQILALFQFENGYIVTAFQKQGWNAHPAVSLFENTQNTKDVVKMFEEMYHDIMAILKV